jgi:hypothetical protein
VFLVLGIPSPKKEKMEEEKNKEKGPGPPHDWKKGSCCYAKK